MSRVEKFVFSDEWRYRIARHAAFWLAWFLFHGLIYGNFWRGGGSQTFGTTLREALIRSFYLSFSEAIIFMPVHIFLSYSIIYFLLPRYLFKKRYIEFVAGFGVLLMATAGLSHLTAITLIHQFREYNGLASGTNTLLFGLMAGLRGSNTVAGFATAIKLIKYWYLKNEETQKLEKEKLQIELQALRNQLQPHFLFNTLNGLYSLTLHNSAQAPHVVVRLSELLRYMLAEGSKPFANLQAELTLLGNYIELEKIRFGKRLNVSLHVEGNPENNKISPLLLLPFVENCFKHGVRNLLDEVWVSLSVVVKDNELTLKLINSKPTEKSDATSMGIGIQNIRKRLQLIYPDRHRLKITDAEDTYIVSLWIQLDSDEKTENNELLELQGV